MLSIGHGTTLLGRTVLLDRLLRGDCCGEVCAQVHDAVRCLTQGYHALRIGDALALQDTDGLACALDPFVEGRDVRSTRTELGPDVEQSLLIGQRSTEDSERRG